MAERTSGARAVLSRPGAYNLVQRLLGEKSSRARFVSEHLRPQPGDRVLDIGCGPGNLAALLPDARYVGIDLNPDYIAAARERFGERAEFHCLDVTDAAGALPERQFDLATITGLIHHLDDGGADSVFRLAARSLVDTGRLVVLENTYFEGQSRFARWMIGRDRGINVREPEAYAGLARRFFEGVEWVVREDLLRVPYTHVILECVRPLREDD